MRFFGFLFLVGFIGAYIWQIIVVCAIAGLAWAAVRGVGYLQRLDDEDLERVRGLVRRADRQHALVQAGDERGVYGMYPPAIRVGE